MVGMARITHLGLPLHRRNKEVGFFAHHTPPIDNLLSRDLTRAIVLFVT
jgi:hypothetical protein